MTAFTVLTFSGVFRGGRGRWCDWTALGLTVNFCTVFVSFVLQMNRKIRVPLLLLLYSSVCPCFLPVKNCIKMHSNLSFWGQKIIFFLGKRLNYTSPLNTYGASPPPYWNRKYATAYIVAQRLWKFTWFTWWTHNSVKWLSTLRPSQ